MNPGVLVSPHRSPPASCISPSRMWRSSTAEVIHVTGHHTSRFAPREGVKCPVQVQVDYSTGRYSTAQFASISTQWPDICTRREENFRVACADSRFKREKRKRKRNPFSLIHVKPESSRPFCRACTLHDICYLSSRLRKQMHHGLRLRLSEMQLFHSGHSAGLLKEYRLYL